MASSLPSGEKLAGEPLPTCDGAGSTVNAARTERAETFHSSTSPLRPMLASVWPSCENNSQSPSASIVVLVRCGTFHQRRLRPQPAVTIVFASGESAMPRTKFSGPPRLMDSRVAMFQTCTLPSDRTVASVFKSALADAREAEGRGPTGPNPRRRAATGSSGGGAARASSGSAGMCSGKFEASLVMPCSEIRRA